MRGITLGLPGAYGLNTQSDIADDQALRFAGLASNAVIDASGKLAAREDFVNQTTGQSLTLNVVFSVPNDDSTDTILSAGSGVVWSGVSTLTSRFNYQSGAQIADVGGAKAGATATGLANDTTTYGLTISINGGGSQQVTVTGSAAQTYTTLVSEINTDITGGSVSLVGGNLKFVSATIGSSSTVSVTNTAGTASVALLTTLTNFVAVRTASAGTTTNNNWQFAAFNNRIAMAQASQHFTLLNGSTFAVESVTGQPWTSSPNCVIAAYGRLWVADDAAGNERDTIWWSNLLSATAFSGGDAGELSLKEAWPAGADHIVSLAATQNRLIVLGRRSILMYTLPADNNPASMSLTDTITNVGCVSRDSVVQTPDGIYFLSDNGVMSIGKLGQVTQLLTLPNVSQLVADDMQTDIAAATATQVRGGYNVKQGWYVLTFPASNKTYCFHTRRYVETALGEKVPAVTTWTNSNMPFRGFALDRSGNWYCAATNGVHKYSGYTPDGASTAYNFEFYTQWLNMGDESKLKILKYVVFVMEVASGKTGTARWSMDYMPEVVRTESFSTSGVEHVSSDIGEVKIHLGGTGGTFRVGFLMTVSSAIALHQMRIYAVAGGTKL